MVERVHLRALTLVDGRAVNLDRVDRSMARTMFVLHALVRGEWETHHRFVTHNRERIEEVRAMEDRARRRDILVDEDAVFDFFDQRIPADVTDVRRFDRWWRDRIGAQPDLLDLTVEDLTALDAGTVDEDAFPRRWSVEVPVDYEFAPGSERDGAWFEIPVAVLNRTDPEPFAWLVPGLRAELVTALIRALPKAVRRSLVPAPDRAAEVIARTGPDDGPLLSVLAQELSRMAGVPVEPSMWDDVALPEHLRPHFRILGDDGAVLAEGSDLAALERRLRAHVRATVASGAPELECDGLTTWSIDTLPRVVTSEAGGLVVEGYPALIDTTDSVGVRVLASRAEQQALHWNGTRRLLALQLPRPARTLQRAVDPRVLLRLATAPHGTVIAATDDALLAVLDALLLDHGGPVFDEAAFGALLATVKERYVDDLVGVVTAMADAVQRAGRLRERLGRPAPVEWSPALDDLTDQLTGLVFDGMAVTIGAHRIGHLPRYLDAMEIRLDRLRENLRSDTERMLTVRRLVAEHAALVADRGLTAGLDDVRWMIEELRVQLFAQQLGTAEPVSAQRVRRALDRIRRR